jgi:MerR family transcriptional regulator/heat shock protein HspR
MNLPTPGDGRPAPSQGVYGISVAAELAGSAPQNLRLYEARGLLAPARSDGGTRRYSNDDLDRVRQIARLLDAGLNLAGVAMVLTLQDANEALQAQLDELAPSRGQGASDAPATEPVPARRRRR